ncbi:MAG: hypothetical protein ACTHOL_00750, partial [Luteibacter jiangsuensis]
MTRGTRPLYWLGFIAALAFACSLFSAIPGVALPTLGQAIWATAFAESYAHQGILAVHAVDFGLPAPAAIAFGLSGTFVQGQLIRFGFAPMDAYSAMVASYLALALFGAALLARSFGASRGLSLILCAIWLTLPIGWGHVNYSMVALGFVLLPFYMYAVVALLASDTLGKQIGSALFMMVNCTLSAFMDGYTFIMFAVGTAILWSVHVATRKSDRLRALLFALPCIALAFGTAYLLYSAFIGGNEYATSSLDMFRAMGVDITMLMAPTRGTLWAWNILHLGVTRNPERFWGDGSIWATAFVLPLLLTGVAGWVFAPERKTVFSWLIIASAGIYLSLGPSLKVNATKDGLNLPLPESMYAMPEQYAPIPTGSRWLSTHVPGFMHMRASYRWVALGMLGLWALTVVLLVVLHRRNPRAAYAMAAGLIVAFMPPLPRVLKLGIANREHALDIVRQLVPDLSRVAAGGRVLFVPHGNDFIAPYLATSGGFKTYNIGGDKNVEMARQAWSEPMRRL